MLKTARNRNRERDIRVDIIEYVDVETCSNSGAFYSYDKDSSNIDLDTSL